MKLVNPNYISPAVAYANSVKTAVADYLVANKALSTIDFDKIRADFPSEAATLTDGMIAEVCRALGIGVVE